jgi:hypothetical protein
MDENDFKRLLEESAAETHRRIHDTAKQMKLHFDITVEDMRKDIRRVAEGVLTVDEKLDRETADIRAEVRQGFADTQAMLRVSRNDLDHRVTRLERTAN